MGREVRDVALGAAQAGRDQIVGAGVAAAVPLLQLDDDGRIAQVGVLACDHAVEPLAGHRELVFEQDAVIVELGVVQDLRHGAQRVPPGVDLGGRGLEAKLPEERILQLLRDAVVHAVADEVGREAGVELHGWGSVTGVAEHNPP